MPQGEFNSGDVEHTELQTVSTFDDLNVEQ